MTDPDRTNLHPPILSHVSLYRSCWKNLCGGVLLAALGSLLNLGAMFLSIRFLGDAFSVGKGCDFNYVLPATLIRVLSIIRSPMRWSEKLVNHALTLELSKELRVRVLRKSLETGKKFRGCGATLLNTFVRDVETMDQFHLRLLLPLVEGSLLAASTGGVLLLLNRQSFVVFSTAMLVTFLGCVSLSHLGKKPSVGSISRCEEQYRRELNNLIIGNAGLNLRGFIDVYLTRLRTLELNRYLLRMRQIRRCSASRIGVVLLIGSIFIPGSCLTLLSTAGVSHPSDLALFILLMTVTLSEMMARIPLGLRYLDQFIHSARKLDEIVGQGLDHLPILEEVGFSRPRDLQIDIRGLRFGYPDSERLAVDNLSMKVESGERVAILGHTGSGKSTLIKLLIRFLTPDAGEIRFNKLQLSSLSANRLRDLVAVVPQEVYIFSATLRENLILTRRDAVDDASLIEVLRKLDLENLLSEAGLDSQIGRGGRQISGGEKRRLGIARLLLKRRARLWLFDEPTESLDRCSAQRVSELINHPQLTDGRTTIIVTHRLDLLENVDSIYVMDDGAFLEQGTHEQLTKRRGRYHDYRQILDREAKSRSSIEKKFSLTGN